MMCSYECGISVGEKKASVLLSLADHDNIIILIKSTIDKNNNIIIMTTTADRDQRKWRSGLNQ